MTQRFARWRELLAERVDEAVAELGAVPGVRGLILGGSVGRGEPWPMSDIDILPITDGAAETNDEVTHCQSRIVDWWAASGRAQTLDVSWLRFVDSEVERAIGSEASFAAERMKDRLWLHGMDKSYGGKGAADPERICVMGAYQGGFVALATAMAAPDLVRCVATRTAPTDLGRWMTQTRKYIYSARSFERFGDPGRNEQRERMAHASPLIQPERLKASLLLVHVQQNRGTRPSHSRDLASAVRKAGGDVELVIVSDEDGGMHKEENWIAYANKLVEFFGKHLTAGN